MGVCAATPGWRVFCARDGCQDYSVDGVETRDEAVQIWNEGVYLAEPPPEPEAPPGTVLYAPSPQRRPKYEPVTFDWTKLAAMVEHWLPGQEALFGAHVPHTLEAQIAVFVDCADEANDDHDEELGQALMEVFHESVDGFDLDRIFLVQDRTGDVDRVVISTTLLALLVRSPASLRAQMYYRAMVLAE
jgi:hypothetical protein